MKWIQKRIKEIEGLPHGTMHLYFETELFTLHYIRVLEEYKYIGLP
jgi:hypothetical protein